MIFGGHISDEAMTAFASCIVVIIQLLNLIITFYCPYAILRQLRAPTSGKKKHASLVKVLSRKSHFFAFVQHLAHELSVEVCYT